MKAPDNRWQAVACLMLWVLGASAVQAEIDGHGPDAWRVTGVAAGDVLNARMGPGTSYPVIDHFDPDENGLQQVTCVPLLTPKSQQVLSPAERGALSPRWCLMRSADLTRAGWVAGRYLAEGSASVMTAAEQAQQGPVLPHELVGDTQLDAATVLVRDLYQAFTDMGSDGADNPLSLDQGGRYFAADLLPRLKGHGADLLYGGQDFDGEILRIGPDPDQAMFRGMVNIRVQLRNFGQQQRISFSLRADPRGGESPAPLRIFRVTGDGWQFD